MAMVSATCPHHAPTQINIERDLKTNFTNNKISCLGSEEKESTDT